MANNNKEELIATLTKLIATLAEAEAAPRDKSNEQPAAPSPALPPDTVEMLTVRECCDAVKGLNEYTVRQLVTRGEIPFVRAGQGKRGKILIPKTALIDYFNNCAKKGGD